MKKKRKNRWKNGFIHRTKTCSNLNSKDNHNTAEESGEEDEEKDGKLSESEDPGKIKDVECESMETDGSARAEEPTESTAVAQNNNIPNEGQEPAEDEVVNVETVQSNATDGHNDEESESSEPKKTEPIAEDNTGTG